MKVKETFSFQLRCVFITFQLEAVSLSDMRAEILCSDFLASLPFSLYRFSFLFPCQNEVKELTRHLEECTNALQKSLHAQEDRKKVLKEIDELKNEQRERQKTDETYYRNTEKIDILTDQLTDAKSSLEQAKQETLDNTVFTNRVLETFSSVSPTRSKRTLYNDKSSRLKSSRTSLFQESSSHVPTYLEELEERTPTRDTKSPSSIIRHRNKSPTKSRQESATGNDLDPMSMTDEEFDRMFLPKKDDSLRMTSPVTRHVDNDVHRRRNRDDKEVIPP